MSPGPLSIPSVPILGQPFTVTSLRLAVNVLIHCNCMGAPTSLTILASAPAPCPACGKVYLASFNPATGTLEVATATQESGDPS